MTTLPEKILALLCASFLAYEYIFGGLPKVVLLISCVGLIMYFISFIKSLNR